MTENNIEKNIWEKIEHWKFVAILLAVFDAIAVNTAFMLAMWTRFDCSFNAIPEEYMKPFVHFAPVYTPLVIVVFFVCKLYQSVWRFASYNEAVRCFLANTITGVIHIVVITAFYHRMPVSYYVLGIVLQFIFTVGVRFSYRFYLLQRQKMVREGKRGVKNAMLVGAGAAGQMILKELTSGGKENIDVKCIVDDNTNKSGRYLYGIPIEGTREDIPQLVQKYGLDIIYVAIPSANNVQKMEILNICKETGCEVKILPGMRQIINDEVSIAKMKDVSIEDLLGRDTIQVNTDEIFKFILDRRVLVTGGGGSIGSELCRQIASHSPKQLIIFDVYENNAYDIEQELKRHFPTLNLVTLIGSVRDSRRVNSIFNEYRPEIVFHAAAHKHVPLMEQSPCESIKNNVIGTYKTALAALKYGTEKFVLISTDKAVNPTNVMGASKRLCEMVIQTIDRLGKEGKAYLLPELYGHFEGDKADTNSNEYSREASIPALDNTRYSTDFVAVRFGNVLGSNGSVIPLFKKQIAEGGPVTVTHPDIVRYFMTIPEAVSLVLQAGAYAKGGEIYVLDMGSPVKIDTLARNLIKLSGYKPDVDIKIVYTGTRPGEKLYEEKLMDEEGLRRTDNQLIHIAKPIKIDYEDFLTKLQRLAEESYRNSENIKDVLIDCVNTYHPEDEWKLTYYKQYGEAPGFF